MYVVDSAFFLKDMYSKEEGHERKAHTEDKRRNQRRRRESNAVVKQPP